MTPREIIYQNFPHCQEHSEKSFLGVLHEESRFDMDAYWRLEWALVLLTDEGHEYPKYLAWPIFRIFSALMQSFNAHAQPNDLYSISNLSKTQEYDFRERVQLVFEGFFKGEVPNFASWFDERNPLLP